MKLMLKNKLTTSKLEASTRDKSATSKLAISFAILLFLAIGGVGTDDKGGTVALLKQDGNVDKNPVDTIEVTNPVETVEVTNPIETVKVTNPVETVKDKNPVETSKVTNPVETVKVTNPVETVEVTNPVETVGNTNARYILGRTNTGDTEGGTVKGTNFVDTDGGTKTPPKKDGNGGTNGGTNFVDTHGGPNKPPVVLNCDLRPIPDGCAIVNPFLADAIDLNQPSFIIEMYNIKRGSQSYLHKDSAYTVKEAKYGTITLPTGNTEYTEDYFKTVNFIEAESDNKLKHDNNNIIQIRGISSKQSSDETNYYYSHIGGKQFTRFLPAINKLQILGLNAKYINEYNANATDTGGLIYYSPLSRNNKVYPKLKGLAEKVQSLTFKGFSLSRFYNRVGINNIWTFYLEKKIYPGSFTLTFNSLNFDYANRHDDNYFSIKITFDQQAPAVSQELNEGNFLVANEALVDNVQKPAVKTIEIKDYKFSRTHLIDDIKTYAKNATTSWMSIAALGSDYLAFNQLESGGIDQIAGKIELSRINGKTNQYLVTTFASNEFFKPGDDGYVNVNDLLDSRTNSDSSFDGSVYDRVGKDRNTGTP